MQSQEGSEQKQTEVKENMTSNTTENNNTKTDMTNVLKHIQDLESNNSTLKNQLKEAVERTGKLSAKTREGMQSALDTLMKKWMDAVETKDPNVKDEFKGGLERLVKNSAEDNGVWQMMVSASSLYQRQEHDLDKLRTENTDLKQRVDGMYGTSESRTGDKRARLDRGDRVDGTQAANDAADHEPARDSIWADFASSMAQF